VCNKNVTIRAEVKPRSENSCVLDRTMVRRAPRRVRCANLLGACSPWVAPEFIERANHYAAVSMSSNRSFRLSNSSIDRAVTGGKSKTKFFAKVCRFFRSSTDGMVPLKGFPQSSR